MKLNKIVVAMSWLNSSKKKLTKASNHFLANLFSFVWISALEKLTSTP
jgi:hypothetical protein